MFLRNSSENEVEMDIGEGKTGPKKPNLAEIREKLLCKRTTEAFTDYCGVESDPSLTLVEKIIKLQKAIGDATRRKIYFVSLLGELLQSCFNHGLFTNGWETRSRDVWKPVSNRTPGIISKICKLRVVTPVQLRPVGTLQDFALLDMGKMTPAR